MIEGYPSHSYVIDQHELADIGFDAQLYPPELVEPMKRIFHFAADEVIAERDFIKLVRVVDTSNRTAAPQSSSNGPPAGENHGGDETPKG